ncbi:hypothetical protein D9M68_631320 [compost metagenome]
MRRLDGQLAIADQGAAVAHMLGADAEVGAGVAAVVRFDARLDHPAVDHLGALEADVARGGQALLVAQLTLRLQLGAAGGIGPLGQRDALGLEFEIAAGRGLRQGQLTIAIDLDIAGAGGQIAGQLDPDPGLGADQADRPGVHATQRGAVDGQERRIAGTGSLGGGRQAVRLDLVAPGDDVELIGVQLGVELGAAGDQVELVDVAGVEAGAFDTDLPAVDVEAIQAAALDDRLAGGQRRPRRVDEAAAVAGDAVRVGHDHRGRLAGHFAVAPQLAGVGSGDLVEDQPGGLALQVRVAEDDPAQLGALGSLSGIVEDQPLLADVEFAELVVRQAAAVGRGDIDDGHAVAGLAQAGVAAGLGVHGQLRRGGDDRVEQQHAAEDQGDVLEHWAANVHVKTPTGRLTGMPREAAQVMMKTFAAYPPPSSGASRHLLPGEKGIR